MKDLHSKKRAEHLEEITRKANDSECLQEHPDKTAAELPPTTYIPQQQVTLPVEMPAPAPMLITYPQSV